MGFRDGLKQGGGFWNNVNVTVKSMNFTAKGPNEKKDGEWVYLVPTVRVDGQDKDTDSHLFLGAAKNYEISKDGKSVTGIDDRTGKPTSITTFQTKKKNGQLLGAGTFIMSLIDNGFPEDELPDLGKGEALSLQAVEGYRLRLKQLVDEVATKELGKRKAKEGDGAYDRTTPVVETVYGKDEAAGKGSKGMAAKGSKASKGDDALTAATDAAVVALIESNVTKTNKTGETPTAKVSMAVFRS